MRIIRALLVLSILVVLTGCGQLTTTEYGIVFRKLPPFLGGGIANKLVSPGEYVILMPWDSLYRFDTSLKYISWNALGEGDKQAGGTYVYTRSLDGNEVALAVTVQYRISPDKESLRSLVRYVASSNEAVQRLVLTVGRADIRTYMNELKTSAFFDRNSRYRAIDKVRDSMNKKLNSYGILIEKVILDEHRFERLLADGKVDRSYQEKIDETQKLGQDTERELLRIDTIKAKKSQELNEAQGRVNRTIAEAQGVLNQSKARGEGYLQAKTNEAEGLLALGKAEAEGLEKQVKALAGPGGRAMLKLEFARTLSKTAPKYVLLPGASEGSGIDLRKLDSNQLLKQIGIIEGMKDEPMNRADAKSTNSQSNSDTAVTASSSAAKSE